MGEPRTLYVATKNAGKVRELAAIFPRSEWRIATFAAYEDVIEGERTYAENARLKAVALRRQLDVAGIEAPVLGDDSGIEVGGLGGIPGVLSARYGGPDASWSERRALLRAALGRAGTADRTTRFVCALCYIGAEGTFEVQADVAGELSPADAGDGGFSYDAAFLYPPARATFAEMSEDEKNRVSHRARAVAALLSALGAELRPPLGNTAPAGM